MEEKSIVTYELEDGAVVTIKNPKTKILDGDEHVSGYGEYQYANGGVKTGHISYFPESGILSMMNQSLSQLCKNQYGEKKN